MWSVVCKSMLKTLVASLETSQTWHNSSHTYRLPVKIFFAAAAIEELGGHEHARLVTTSSTHPDARGFHRIGVPTLPQILETSICHVSSTRLQSSGLHRSYMPVGIPIHGFRDR